jgi:hypothetical protein
MKVFRKGQFYIYDESLCDASWSNDQILQASSLYATCIHLGYNEEMSYSLSHMYIYSLYMPGLKYPEEYIKKIEKILHLGIVREKH